MKGCLYKNASADGIVKKAIIGATFWAHNRNTGVAFFQRLTLLPLRRGVNPAFVGLLPVRQVMPVFFVRRPALSRSR